MPQEALRPGVEADLESWSLPGLRLVPVPDVAPPYDDPRPGERGRGERAVVGVVASAGPVLGPSLPQHAGRAGPGEGRRAGGRQRPGGEEGMALALVIVEVLAGVRPERQLVPLATDRVRGRVKALGPVLRGAQRPRITRVRACQPAPRVLEMAVVVTAGPRARAVALRLEQATARAAAPGRAGRAARWRCTALEVG